MSLDIVYSSGNREHRFRLTSTEFEALTKFAERRCNEAFDIVFGRPALDRVVSVDATELVGGLRCLVSVIRSQADGLGYLYDVRVETPRGSRNYCGGGSGISGLKIGGQCYDLEHGYDKCMLIKKWWNTDGKIHMSDAQDVRHMTVLKTDVDGFLGDVKIIKRKAGRLVLKKLAELERFLAGCSEKNVTVGIR